MVKKGEFWYLYNISTGSLVINNPITSTWENVNKYYNGSGQVALLKIETADGYIKYVTNDGIEIDEDTATHTINKYNYESRRELVLDMEMVIMELDIVENHLLNSYHFL